MRLWSVHPKYLDAKGLVALWREALLAKNVLEGNTKGYKHHPQLIRFRNTKDPVSTIHCYLKSIHGEAHSRGYNFNRDKVIWEARSEKMEVTDGQMDYERKHLLNKLRARDSEKHIEISSLNSLEPNPLLSIIPGGIEDWEIL